MPNMLIRNAMIIDGTGREAFKGSVYVIGDRIEAVIPSTAGSDDDIARKEHNNIIDAQGLAVAPGFIDCHSHFDWALPLSHHQEFLFPLIEQGVTTVVTGNCGFSPAPVNAPISGSDRSLVSHGVNFATAFPRFVIITSICF